MGRGFAKVQKPKTLDKMINSRKNTKNAGLKKGQPFIVDPREAAKAFKGYDTSPEVLLACIVVSGTLDTAEILRTEILLANEMQITGEQQRSYDAFRRVWATPTEAESDAVMELAEKILAVPRSHKTLVWKMPLLEHHPDLLAFAAPDGSIGFSLGAPEESIVFLVCGRGAEVLQAVRETAVLGQDGKTWFVPGARQAPISITSRNALRAYVMKLTDHFDRIEARRRKLQKKSPPDDPERK